MPTDRRDLWGIHADIEAVRANSRHPLFAEWTQAFLAGLSADRDKAPELPAEPSERARAVSVQAQNCGFAYVLTGDEQLALRAREVLDALGRDEGSWFSPHAGGMYPWDRADLTTAEITKACANSLSWISPVLGEDDRERFARMIAERGGRPIYEGATRGCWWGTALNSNWTAVLNSGLGFAALMLWPYDEDTAGEWLSFARERVVAMLDLAAEEGAGVEGAGYWLYCFGSIQDLVEALRNANDDDLYGHRFWSVCSRFLPYVALPDFSAWVNYADTAYRGLGGSHFFHGVASRVGDSLAQRFGSEIARQHGGLSWKNLVYYDPAVPEGDVEQELPCRLFRSIQLASMRSDWGEDAAFMLFKGGSNAWSHTHLDLNGFFITGYGERLATEPGPAPYSIDYWHSIEPVVSTAWHNCIVVDGGHQRVPAQYAMSYDLEEAGDCYSRLGDYLDSDALTLVSGDASSAYADTLEHAYRDVVFLKPGVFVIHDDLLARPVRCQRNLEWMLHSECEMSDVDGAIEALGERGKLLIQPVLPAGWEHKYVARKTIPHADGKPLHCVSVRPPWHHKWNIDPQRSPYPDWDPRGGPEPLGSGECHYLVVLAVLRPDDPAPFALEGIEQGSARGAVLKSDCETAIVLFNRGGGDIGVGDLRTDAEKVAVRRRAEGLSWAVAGCTHLSWEGQVLLDEPARSSRTGFRPVV